MRVFSVFGQLVAVCISLLVVSTNGMAHPEEHSDTNQPTIETPDVELLILAKVIRVFDADTVLLQIGDSKQRYQILGANGPEYQPRARVPKPFSIESRRFLEQLILGESVYIQLDPYSDRDAIHRRTGYLFRAPDMLFVNLELVRQGYAKHDPRGMTIYADVFHFYESRAQTLVRGIWDPDTIVHRPTPADEIEDEADRSSETDSDSGGQDRLVEKTTPDRSKPVTRTPTISSNTIVYITKSGSKYHAKGCSHLSKSNKSVTRESVKNSHQPCKSCHPNG